jgi:alkylhydroperoxidase family enzyme
LEKAPHLYHELLPKLQGEAELSEREAAALAFAERLASDHHAIDAGFMASMRQLFSDPEIVELGFVTAAFMMYGRLHMVFGTAPMPTATHELLSGDMAKM